MGPKKLLVFDLETVPDVELARKLWPETEPLDDMLVVEKIYDVMKEASGGKSDFPRPVFHKIVAIGCLLADIEMVDGMESYHFRKLGCIGEPGDSEADLVKAFFDFGGRDPLRLVSFNGRGFDVPVLKMRALRHGISARWMFQSGDKWSNYGSRYDMVWHVDLADVLADFGAARGMPKLDEVCTLAGLPGKLDMDGSRVVDRIAAGDVAGVRAYCETDVLNTYLLYLKYQHLAGALTDDMLRQDERSVEEYCREGKHAHLTEFVKAWRG